MPGRTRSLGSCRGLAAILLAILCLGILGERPAMAVQTAGCLERAAAWAGVHPTLLRAIAWVESHGDPRAVHWNRNGTFDVGLMQINSSWYRAGLEPWWRHLGHPCVNVAAGAWVLKQCMATLGYTWKAVGCYNAGPDWEQSPARAPLARRYIGLVQAALRGAGIGGSRRDSRKLLLTEPGG